MLYKYGNFSCDFWRDNFFILVQLSIIKGVNSESLAHVE